MTEMTWASVACHIQNWYEGLLRTSEVYDTSAASRVFATDAELAAEGVASIAQEYVHLGFPHIQTRERLTLPMRGLGEEADEVYRLLDKTQEELNRFSFEYEEAFWHSGEREPLGFSDAETFVSAIYDINSRLSDLKRLNGEALQLRTQAWRAEMRETVPSWYIEESGFAAVRVQGYAATKTLLALHRAGIPSQWLGTFMPWERASSRNIVDRVVQAHAEAIPAEYMVGLL